MAKQKKTAIEDRIPADVLAAIDEAAVEIAADTNLTRAEARDRILAKLGAAADAADVDDAADEVEDEEDGKGKKGKKGGKDEEGKKGKKDDEDEDEDEDGDEDDEDDEDEDDEDKKPPPSHWSSKPLFGGKK